METKEELYNSANEVATRYKSYILGVWANCTKESSPGDFEAGSKDVLNWYTRWF